MKNNTKKNTKKLRNKKGGSRKRKYTSTSTSTVGKKQQKRELEQNKIDKITTFLSNENTILKDVKGRLFSFDSLMRSLSNYKDIDTVNRLTEDEIHDIYVKWRKFESEKRKGHRENKRKERKGSTPIVRKHTVQQDRQDPDEELRTYAAAAADALTNMNKYGSNEFPVPGSPNPTVDAYPRGFTPNDRRETPRYQNVGKGTRLFGPSDEIYEDDDDFLDMSDEEDYYK